MLAVMSYYVWRSDPQPRQVTSWLADSKARIMGINSREAALGDDG